MILFFRVCSVVLIMSIVIVLNGCAGPRSEVERHSITTPQLECFSPRDLGSKPDDRAAEAGVSSLLGYVRRLRAQPLDAQEYELRRIEEVLEREYRPAEVLRLGLLLLLPETSFRNETRTRQLLRQMPKAGISEDYLGLAEILLVLLEAQEAQKRVYSRLERRWQTEQEQRKTLQEQLEAIKVIEKTMTEQKRPATLPLEDVN